MTDELIHRIAPWVHEMRLALIQSHSIGVTDNPEDIPDHDSDVRREVAFLTKWLQDASKLVDINLEETQW